MEDYDYEMVEFKATDRCDRCGAQAYSMARKGDMEILFCIHHRRENKEALLNQGFEVIDDYAGLMLLADLEGLEV